MIWEIIKKQGLTFLRNPQQLFLLLALPIILIVILSISLSGFISGGTVEIKGKVALIEHSDEQEQIELFIQEVESKQLHEVEKALFIETAQQLQLVTMLKKDVFLEIENMIQLEEVPAAEKKAALKNDEYAAIIEIPVNFTYDSLHYLLFNEGKAGTITLYKNEGKEITAAGVKSVLDSFQEQLTFASLATQNHVDVSDLKVDAINAIGEIMPMEQRRSITSKEYYTVAMAVMNVLFIATAIASFAFLEKESQVFNRVILSNVSRWIYFIGVFASGAIFAFIQLIIIFGFSALFFGVTWRLLQFITVTIVLAMAVGGLAVFLTAISYRMNSEAVTNFFSMILIAFLALLGGSFFPIGDLSNTLQWIGDLTPNGAGMSAYLHLLRGSGLADIKHHLFFLIVFTISLIVIAVCSFPKRGQG